MPRSKRRPNRVRPLPLSSPSSTNPRPTKRPRRTSNLQPQPSSSSSSHPPINITLPLPHNPIINLLSSQYTFYDASILSPSLTHISPILSLHPTWTSIPTTTSTPSFHPRLFVTNHQNHLLLVLLPIKQLAIIEDAASLLSPIRSRKLSLHPSGGTHPTTDPLIIHFILTSNTHTITLPISAINFLTNAITGARVTDLDQGLHPNHVYQAVARTPNDQDQQPWKPFLNQVQSDAASSVNLRPYQRRAVAWMLAREKAAISYPKIIYVPTIKEDALQVLDDDMKEYICNHVQMDPVSGMIWFGDEMNVEMMYQCDKGGLLCDEMGLGKTVEFLTLIMSNKAQGTCEKDIRVDMEVKMRRQKMKGRCSICGDRCRKDRMGSRTDYGIECEECGTLAHDDCLLSEGCAFTKQAYVCSWCCARMQRYSQSSTPAEEVPATNATLIVVPPALLLQWKGEICKHINDSVKIKLFEGLKRSPYLTRKEIMNLDVVITTYNALQGDINTFNAFRSPRQGLRNAKRFHPSPVPLLSVRWRRVAFDESQMISSGTSKAREMARHLRATYRWCITGTPISTSARDMLPLLTLIQQQNVSRPMPWTQLMQPSSFQENQNRLYQYLRTVMWRTNKEHLKHGDELNIPPQTAEVVRIDFGPIERYNYLSILRRARAASLESKEDGQSERDIALISRDLVMMLRQAACHPQVGISGASLLNVSTVRMLNRTSIVSNMPRVTKPGEEVAKRAANPLSMDAVLESLLAKALAEADDSLRSFVASSNGLAGIHLILYHSEKNYAVKIDNLKSAVGLYRECLKLREENKTTVSMDTIQYMHILHNLGESFEIVSSVAADLHGQSGTRVRVQSNQLHVLQERIEKLLPKEGEREYGNIAKRLQTDYINEAKDDLEKQNSSLKELNEKLGDLPLNIPPKKNTEDEENIEEEMKEPESPQAETTSHQKKNTEDEESAEEMEEPESPQADATSHGSNREPSSWWEHALAFLIEDSRGGIFVSLLVDTLLANIPTDQLMSVKTLAQRITSVYSLTTVLTTELEELHGSRKKMLEHLSSLPGFNEPTLAEIIQSGNCSSCRDFGRGPPCAHCRSEKVLYELEKRLYFLRSDKNNVKKRKTRGRRNRNHAMSEALEAQLDVEIQGVSSSTPKSYSKRQSYARFPGELESAFRVLAADLRKQNVTSYDEEIDEFFEKFSQLKQELKDVTNVFEAQRTLLARMDEVNMAISRISLREDNDEVVSEFEARTCIKKSQINPIRMAYESEVRSFESIFLSKRGSVMYLKTLTQDPEKSETNNDEAENDRRNQCPICWGSLTENSNKVGVLRCAHVFCYECTMGLIKTRRDIIRKEITCPTCRCTSEIHQVNFTSETAEKPKAVEPVNKIEKEEDENIRSNESQAEPVSTSTTSRISDRMSEIRKKRMEKEKKSTFHDNDVLVHGNPGAKQTSIIKLLKGIWKKDDKAKVIIFSEWLDMLNLTSKALLSNGIDSLSCRSSNSPQSFAKMIHRFRSNVYPKVILLQLRNAAAGLNLTEANHVILCEPVVDTAIEAQALSRVHRMGQTKQTYVHRLVVNNTIEDTLLDFAEQQKDGIMTSETRCTQDVRFEDIIETIHL